MFPAKWFYSRGPNMLMLLFGVYGVAVADTEDKWHMAQADTSCRDACKDIGGYCNDQALKDNNSDVNTGERIRNMLKNKFGVRKLNSNCDAAMNGPFPIYVESTGECYGKTYLHQHTVFSCAAIAGPPNEGKRRICYCKDVPVEKAASGGDENCACTGKNDGIPKKNKKFYGTGYGKSCKAWDLSHRYCSSERQRAKDNRECWCPKSWCYVNKSCYSAKPSALFQNADLYYSYEACDNEGDQCFVDEDEFVEAADDEIIEASNDLLANLNPKSTSLEEVANILLSVGERLDYLEMRN